MSQGAFILVAVAGIVGAFRLRRERQFQLVALFAAVSLSGALVSFGQPRFGLPTMLLVLIAAARAVLSTSAIGAGRAWR